MNSIKIGITGGIGSGKTMVCKIFEVMDIPVYYADIESKKIVNNDIEIKNNLILLFGKSIYLQNKTIDKKQFSEIIFNDKQILEKVNSIIHPVVKKHYEQWLVENKEYKYTIKEAAILFESGSYKQVDKIITVVSPLEKRIERICKRDSLDRELILKKINNQMSDEEKIKNSDFVIYNNDKTLLLPQILKIIGVFHKCQFLRYF